MMEEFIKKEKCFAFNVWSCESAAAVMKACKSYGKDALLQTSMKAYRSISKVSFRQFVTEYAKENKMEAYLHLDHCKSIDEIKEAISYGWDSVMFDGSDLELEENIELTNQICDIAHKNHVLVEAEVGQIIGVDGVAQYDDVTKFIDKTQVDMLAVAIGTKHGLYKGEAHLSYDLLNKVDAYSGMPLVIHGGTGLQDEILKELLAVNHVRKINISTDVKLAYLRGTEKAKDKGNMNEDGFDPIVVMDTIQSEIVQMVREKVRLLGRTDH